VWSALGRGVAIAGRQLAGMMLTGWGAFNLVEGLVDHQVLTIHHVNPENVVLWDVAFLALGAGLVVGGMALARSGRATVEGGRPLGDA
jgi:Predicted membrane protein